MVKDLITKAKELYKEEEYLEIYLFNKKCLYLFLYDDYDDAKNYNLRNINSKRIKIEHYVFKNYTSIYARDCDNLNRIELIKKKNNLI